jgi:hypothetical protein
MGFGIVAWPLAVIVDSIALLSSLSNTDLLSNIRPHDIDQIIAGKGKIARVESVLLSWHCGSARLK